MADLDVQPKKKSSWLTWLLIALALIALIFFLARGCNNNETATETTDTTATTQTDDNDAGSNLLTDWNDIDFNAPAATYEEITDRNINVRGNDRYSIYSLGENILFDEGKSSLRNDAEQSLKQTAASMEKRYNGGQVRIYGYTDSLGSAGANKELAEQRAQAVRDWLINNGNIAEGRITLHPVGESQPVASNTTSEGRQQNRRVEIVVRNAQ